MRKRKKEGGKMFSKKKERKRKRALTIYEWIERNLLRRRSRNSNRMFLIDMDNIPSLSFHSIFLSVFAHQQRYPWEKRKNRRRNARKRKKGGKEVEQITKCASFIHPSFSNKLKAFDEMLCFHSDQEERERREKERKKDLWYILSLS